MATSTNEKMEAAYALLGKIADLDAMNTAMQGATAIAALKAIDLTAATPTAAQLHAAKQEYDAIRLQPSTVYGGATIPNLVNTALWSEIATEVG